MFKIFEVLIIIILIIITYLLVKLRRDLSNRIKILDFKINTIDRVTFLIADKYYPQKNLIFENRDAFYSEANHPITISEVDTLSLFAKENKILFPLENSEEVAKRLAQDNIH